MRIITVTYKNGDTDTLRRASVTDAAAAQVAQEGAAGVKETP